MADLHFYENSEDIPLPLPRSEMRFADVNVQPYADGRRVKLRLKFPPFQERPSVEAWVTNAEGNVVASMSLIEAIEQDFEFTLHLRGPEPRGDHTLHLALYYYMTGDNRLDERQVVDERAISFTLQPPY
jgi:hypothetical protein